MVHHRENIQEGFQEWFEMQDILDGFIYEEQRYDSWVPLKMNAKNEKGRERYAGFIGEEIDIETIVVPEGREKHAEQLRIYDVWVHDLWPESSHGFTAEDGDYIPAHTYFDFKADKNNPFTADYLVLVRGKSSKEKAEWMISQDLITTFGLKQEKDVWVAINDDYKEVIKMEHNDEGDVCTVFIDKEHLKDYLCARNSKLYVYIRRQRSQNIKSVKHINWSDKNLSELKNEKIIKKTHQKKEPKYVKDTIHDIECSIYYGIGTDDRSYRIESILRNTQCINQGEHSYIVRKDARGIPATQFIVDANGKKDTLHDIFKNDFTSCLWFNPKVISDLLLSRSNVLKWERYNLGRIEYKPGWDVLFGINNNGFVNVRSKSLSHLTEEQQNVWASHNIKPNGKVTHGVLVVEMDSFKEFMKKSQKERDRIIENEKAPEVRLPEQCTRLNEIINKKLGFCLFKEINQDEFKTMHRFEAVTKNNEEGLLNLANKINQAIIEQINIDTIKTRIKSTKNNTMNDDALKELGSLKLFETLLSLYIDKDCKSKECQNIPCSYKLLSELYGVYELRKNAAHIPSKDDIAFGRKLCRIDKDVPLVIQAEQLMQSVVECLSSICECCEDIEI